MMVNLREIPAVAIERHGPRALMSIEGMVLIVTKLSMWPQAEWHDLSYSW
jgi:hypothetical protein